MHFSLRGGQRGDLVVRFISQVYFTISGHMLMLTYVRFLVYSSLCYVWIFLSTHIERETVALASAYIIFKSLNCTLEAAASVVSRTPVTDFAYLHIYFQGQCRGRAKIRGTGHLHANRPSHSHIRIYVYMWFGVFSLPDSQKIYFSGIQVHRTHKTQFHPVTVKPQ